MTLVDAWLLTRYEDRDSLLLYHERVGSEDRRFYDTGLPSNQTTRNLICNGMPALPSHPDQS